jgi:hypothetical protein
MEQVMIFYDSLSSVKQSDYFIPNNMAKMHFLLADQGYTTAVLLNTVSMESQLTTNDDQFGVVD